MPKLKYSLLFSCSNISPLTSSIAALHNCSETLLSGEDGEVSLLDTFDWALERNNITLEKMSVGKNANLMITTPTLSLTASCKKVNKPWITLEEIEHPFVKTFLSTFTSQRALLIQANIRVKIFHYELSDKEGMVVSNLWLYQLPEPAKFSLTLVTNNGYEQQHKEQARQLDKLFRKHHLVVHKLDLFDQILSHNGRKRNDYSSGFFIDLEPNTLAAIAAGKALTHLASVTSRNSQWIQAHPDSEFLHDLRVALRRTRSLLKFFQPLTIPLDLTILADELKYFANQTSRTRDLEVFLLKISKETQQDSDNSDLEKIKSALNLEISQSYEALSKVLSSERFLELLSTWSQLATKTFSLPYLERQVPNDFVVRSELKELDVGPRTPISNVAKIQLSTTLKRLLKKGSLITEKSPPESLHKLRKYIKVYRYLLEFYTPLISANNLHTHLVKLKKLQDVLGQFQDSQVQLGILEELFEKIDVDPHSANSLREELLEQQKRSRRAYSRHYHSFSHPEVVNALLLGFGIQEKN